MNSGGEIRRRRRERNKIFSRFLFSFFIKRRCQGMIEEIKLIWWYAIKSRIEFRLKSWRNLLTNVLRWTHQQKKKEKETTYGGMEESLSGWKSFPGKEFYSLYFQAFFSPSNKSDPKWKQSFSCYAHSCCNLFAFLYVLSLLSSSSARANRRKCSLHLAFYGFQGG